MSNTPKISRRTILRGAGVGLALPLSGKFQVVGEAALRAAMLAGAAPAGAAPGGPAAAGIRARSPPLSASAARTTVFVAPSHQTMSSSVPGRS